MKITYFHTLYKKEVTANVCGEIEFKDRMAWFSSGGHYYAVEVKYIRKIEG